MASSNRICSVVSSLTLVLREDESNARARGSEDFAGRLVPDRLGGLMRATKASRPFPCNFSVDSSVIVATFIDLLDLSAARMIKNDNHLNSQ
jgi:hypothetical protein